MNRNRLLLRRISLFLLTAGLLAGLCACSDKSEFKLPKPEATYHVPHIDLENADYAGLKADPVVEKGILYQDHDVTYSLASMKYTEEGLKVEIEIQNDSQYDCWLRPDYMVVDGIVLSVPSAKVVSAGSYGVFNIIGDVENMRLCDITAVHEVSVITRISFLQPGGQYPVEDTEAKFTITTDQEAEHLDVSALEGETVLDSATFKIKVLGWDTLDNGFTRVYLGCVSRFSDMVEINSTSTSFVDGESNYDPFTGLMGPGGCCIGYLETITQNPKEVLSDISLFQMNGLDSDLAINSTGFIKVILDR